MELRILWQNTQTPLQTGNVSGIDTEDLNGNGWCGDDVSALFQLDNSYRYIKLVAWSQSGSFNEPEIDALAGVVPEPTTLLLFGIGLTCLAGARRKFRK